ncbi:MAG: anti-sigma factor [bacterium]
MVRKVLLGGLLVVAMLAWGCSNEEHSMSPNSELAAPEVGAEAANADVPPELRAAIEQALQEDDAKGGVDLARSQALFGFWHDIDGPTTITSPGFYRVTGDFSTADDAIVIQSDWVYLYLGNHTLTGPGAKLGRGVVLDGVQFAAINGGNLENFGLGVELQECQFVSIRGVRITGNDVFADPAHGVAPQIGIMAVNSARNLIFRNRIELVNLGIFMRGGGTYSNRVFGNKLMGGDLGLLGICYNPDGTGNPAGPHDDDVNRNQIERFRGGYQANFGTHEVVFRHNHIKYFDFDIEDKDGLGTYFNNHSMQIAAPMHTLTLNLNGLEDLGPNYAYEGWVIVNGSPVSTGVFTVDGGGTPSQTMFDVLSFDLAGAAKFVLTIEPVPDGDPNPSSTHYLAGDFTSSDASLSVADPAALGDDFTSAMGTFILNTPSTGSDDTDYRQGIWWLDPTGGPDPTLVLPTLPAGWQYEGWVVGGGGPVTTGTFTSVSGFDSDAGGPTAGPDPVPPFPGQDYITPPKNLIGYAAVITIEPFPDNSPMPFTLKPLVDGDITDPGIGLPQGMGNNAASFPTGMAMR